MKKNSVYFLFFVFLSAYGAEPEILWNARFSDSGGSTVWDSAVIAGGGYIVVGEVTTGLSDDKALNISRIDRDGLVLWENTALSLGNASAYSIVELIDGFAVCGICSDSSGKHGLVLKIDNEGNTLWVLDVGYDGNEALFDLTLSPEGHIIAVGYSYNKETSANDVFAVCVSTAGELLWRKRYVAPAYQTAYSVIPAADSESGFILTGSDEGNIFLMSIDQRGNWVWKTNHRIDGIQSGRSVTSPFEGGYMVAGSTRLGGGYSDVILVSFDESGSVIQEYSWGTDGPDNAYSILEIPPAGFVVLVNSNKGTGDGYRPIIYRFDPWLSVIWTVELSDFNSLCYSLIQTFDEGFVVVGKTTSINSNTEYSSCVIRLSAEDLFSWD